MNNKTKGAIAAVAALALLAGGSTFALWNASITAEGGTITAGNLHVALLGEPTWEDRSYDSDPEDWQIEVSSFHMAPGDTIKGTYEIDAALQGESMLADLTLTVDGAPVSHGEDLFDGLEITYTVLDAKYSPIGELTSLQLGTPGQLTLRPAENGDGDGDGTRRDPSTLPPDLNDELDFTVIVTAGLPRGTEDRKLTQSQMLLEDLSVQLKQSRAPYDDE